MTSSKVSLLGCKYFRVMVPPSSVPEDLLVSAWHLRHSQVPWRILLHSSKSGFEKAHGKQAGQTLGGEDGGVKICLCSRQGCICFLEPKGH